MLETNRSLLSLYFFGAFVRIWLIGSDLQQVIAQRIEVATPLNSWKRVVEGLHLHKLGVNPYSGDALHETPLQLTIYRLMVDNFGSYTPLIFVLLDVLTAFLLYLITKQYMRFVSTTERNSAWKYAKESEKLLLKEEDILYPPRYVVATYLFNPYIIFNCVGLTTTVFGNFFLALHLVGMMYSNLLLSAISLSICISQSLYPMLLLSPLFVHYLNVERQRGKAVLSVVLVALFCIILACISHYICGNWNFLHDTYGFILTVPDLHPNTGLFWYFFIEMFEHFRALFIYSFQINVCLLYFIPLSIRFRNDPLLLSVSLLSLIATFKSYPSVGDVGFVLALLPCWKHLYNYIQQGFMVGCCFFVTTTLAPIVWHLWIYSGSANANFYFGVTLAYATAEIFLITDILFAYIKREFTLGNGLLRKVDGKDAQLMLE